MFTYSTVTSIMHFQQAVPSELKSLASKLEDIQPLAGQNLPHRFSMIAFALSSLLALPILQVLGESGGLRPFSATCTWSLLIMKLTVALVYVLIIFGHRMIQNCDRSLPRHCHVLRTCSCPLEQYSLLKQSDKPLGSNGCI